MERLLPRHMQIIYLINALHLDALREKGVGDSGDAVQRLADRRAQRPPRAHGPSGLPRLAQGQWRLGAAQRADQGDRLPRFPQALSGPHRQQDQWRHLPPLAARGQPAADRPARRRRSGRGVFDDPDAARTSSRRFADDAAFQQRFAAAKRANKERLAATDLRPRRHASVDPSALFDVQIKRIHEYKRQLLNILETIALYRDIRAQPNARLRAAREDLRRQGGGELSSGQADHQADQRRGAGRQRRSDGRAAC